MNAKSIIAELIEDEISKLEQMGEKVRFKTLIKMRIRYTIIFGGLFLVSLAVDILPSAFIALILLFAFLYNANNVRVITNLARKSPDTPIVDIIKGDMK